MELNIDDIKIKIWIITNPSGLERGIATIKFGDISISGFRILENDEEHKGTTLFWVAPPAYKTRNGKFQSIFWLKNKELWQKLQEKIIEEYNRVLAEKPNLKSGSDGIPIIEEKNDGNYGKHY
jgi:DNA-binding cell septation regulator SpoVG